MAGMKTEAALLEQVTQDLQRDFRQVPEAVVDSEVKQALRVFEGARIRTYVPVLLHKRVKSRLRTHTG